MATRLTDRIVKALPCPPRSNAITYDTEVKGFGCRVTAAGARAFILNYRTRAGQERRATIGRWPDWNVTAAREEAARLKREIDGGGDPVGERATERAAETVADLCTRFLTEHVAKQRHNTRREYEGILRNHIVPTLGKMKVTAIDFEHVERLHAKISETAPTLANRALAVLGKMFSLAIKWRLRPDNPTKGVKRNLEHARTRYLDEDESERLLRALDADNNQRAADVFRLLLLTGSRRSAVLSARWEHIDLAASTWTKPPAATKQGRRHQIPLSQPALELLTCLHKQSEGSGPVFPGRDGSVLALDYAWRRICRTAGISGLHIHDLRHSFASHLASSGHGLPVIGQLLGHSQPATTARYAHLFEETLRAAAESVGKVVSRKPR